jgi:hypothetical protein
VNTRRRSTPTTRNVGAEYVSVREAEHHAAAKELNKRLREQVRRNRERDERRRHRTRAA